MWRFKVALHISFRFPWQFASTHLNPWVERGVIKANITSTNTTQRPSQGLPWSYPSRVHWAKCLVIWHQIVPTSELYLSCKCFYIISQLVCTLWLVNSAGCSLSFFHSFFLFLVIDSSRKNLFYNLQYGPWLAREEIAYLKHTHPRSSSMQKYLELFQSSSDIKIRT